jgi:hypothetical protein
MLIERFYCIGYDARAKKAKKAVISSIHRPRRN